MNSVRIQLFSVLKARLDSDCIAVATDGNVNVSELLDAACEQYPAMGPYRSVMRLAVNHVYASEDDPVCANDEVALVTPVSGG